MSGASALDWLAREAIRDINGSATPAYARAARALHGSAAAAAELRAAAADLPAGELRTALERVAADQERGA
jgi:uncharacterized protein (DUF885 family)